MTHGFSFRSLILTLAALALVSRHGQAQGILYPRPEIANAAVLCERSACQYDDQRCRRRDHRRADLRQHQQRAAGGHLSLPAAGRRDADRVHHDGRRPDAWSRVSCRTERPTRSTKASCAATATPRCWSTSGATWSRSASFRFPPQGERTIRMRYTEVLKPESGLRKYAYPLSTSRFGARPVGTATVTIKLTTSSPIKNVYSPTHDLSVRKTRRTHGHRLLGRRQRHLRPRPDALLQHQQRTTSACRC